MVSGTASYATIRRIALGPRKSGRTLEIHVSTPALYKTVLNPLPAFAAATAAAARPIRFRTGFVHAESAAIEVRAVNGSNGLLSLTIVCHLNEAETTGLSGISICDDIDATNGTVRNKQRTDRIFRSPKTEVSNVNVFHF
jgi:hypothetical protein